ncbi:MULTISPECIES: hypothetical protein [unclassified Nocardia]|uniref:hypothetical protein n=1 Tax=unclassified Nocardia TaxID=2637762 RepID=UPI00278C15F1|nr:MULTISPECIES: hypothetical protein [unclassified Nocardia]
MITFRALRALYWLYEHRDESVAELPAAVVPSEDARTVFDELVDQRAIVNSLSLGGSYDFCLTSTGRVLARHARDTYRHELALRRTLEWYSAAHDLDPAQLVRNRAADDFSGRLSDREIRDATHHLVALGLCEGRPRADGEFYHVEITARGRAAARRPYLIDETSAPSAPITTISADNYGTVNGNQVIGGQGHTVTANVTQGASLDEVLAALGQLRNAVQDAPDIAGADRDELLEEIDSLTGKAAKHGRGWLKARLMALSVSVSEMADQALAERVQSIVSLIT